MAGSNGGKKKNQNSGGGGGNNAMVDGVSFYVDQYDDNCILLCGHLSQLEHEDDEIVSVKHHTWPSGCNRRSCWVPKYTIFAPICTFSRHDQTCINC